MVSKRDHLLETAERLFYQEGFHATGIDRVIAEAGVARMTLYNHFRSKDALVLAVLGRREQRYWARLNDAVERARADGASRVLAAIEAHGRWLVDDDRQGCMFMKAIGEYAGHSSDIVDAARTHKRRLLSLLEILLQEDGLPPDTATAEQLAMLLEGATAFAQILSPEEVGDQTAAAARQLLSNVPRH